MQDSAHAQCPYCGEPIELLLDSGGGETQSYIEDCEVCCRPMHVDVMYTPRGTVRVRTTRTD